jgi:uncharacterized protein YndB with AHSA1/START domain
MPAVRRSRVIAAPPDAVWRIVGDPNHLPRWWPMVQRVEGVKPRAFTQVMLSKKGRTVRQDFRLARDGDLSKRWEQDIEGTPFERFLALNAMTMAVEPSGDASSKVTLTTERKLKGLSRLGGGSFLLKRATKQQLDEALERLEGLV